MPRQLNDTNTLNHFLTTLKQHDFAGDIATDVADRLVAATDNSIYQIMPQGIFYPRDTKDVQLLLHLANMPEFIDIRFAPRGGGTGTNGQSLTPDFLIDCSRYMHDILDINLEEGWVRVQPGVVLDQLNAELAQHHVFFAPNLSPSNRATLGGMFNTDACGKGSCYYGRTSQHVFSVQCVLSDGSTLQTKELTLAELSQYKEKHGLEGEIYRQVDQVACGCQHEIDERFPKLARHMTGYNLAKIYNERRDRFSLNYLLSGSEGTLVFITELTLKLSPLPKHKHLVAVKYGEFDAALRAARRLLVHQPAAIETIDDKIWSVARGDEIYQTVQPMLAPDGPDTQTRAINLVEFIADDEAELEQHIAPLLADLTEDPQVLGHYHATDPQEINALWDLRKKSVGLLGNVPGRRRPWPFVEDTMVPPENLADYIQEFRALLESYGLQYGMFGHVDAGCLHVRPQLDMTDPMDAKLVGEITEKVNALVKKYGGILWGEHGRGFRTQYTEDYFGPKLMHAMRQIKTVFDPNDKFNPGKIVTSLKTKTEPVPLQSPMRGEFDRQIKDQWQHRFEAMLRCNGNAQCLDYHADHVMCPSAKVTYDRLHSPKGRATIMREWLRQVSVGKPDQQFEKQVYDAMNGCLGCKACASSCPVKVDIPSVKAEFLHHYHTRHKRPWRDHVIARVETMIKWQLRFPRLSRWLMQKNLMAKCIAKLGMVDMPVLAKNLWHRQVAKLAQPTQPVQKVAVVVDYFTQAYEPEVLVGVHNLLTQLGCQVYWVAGQTGKPAHVKGMLGYFKKTAQRQVARLQVFADQGIPLLGIDPSMTFTYRDEYPRALGQQAVKVQLLQEWLAQAIADQTLTPVKHSKPQQAYLLGHCSEKALQGQAMPLWQQVFAAFGHELTYIETGCCGMAGVYGHEVEHQTESKQLFAMSWQQKIDAIDNKENILATGFSCRCQTKRLMDIKLNHPLQWLVAQMES